MQNTIKYKAFVLLTAVVAFSGGCRKIFNLPQEKDYLSTQADYAVKSFSDAILGRTTVLGGGNIFTPVGSTFPMTFTIKNPRFGDGRDASDMLALQPTLVWTQEYTGKETSLAQIEAKRHLENHPILETRGNGDLVWWYTADTNKIKPANTDTIVYPQQQRLFDIKITNSGGSRTISNLSVIPQRDIPYIPSNDYNIYTGAKNTTTPAGHTLVYNYPDRLDGIKGETTDQLMSDPKNATTGTVLLYIRKFVDEAGDPVNSAGVGHRLRIKFLDKDSLSIDPSKFNTTKWQDQVHGFKFDGTPGGEIVDHLPNGHAYVEYNVAYPIPLAKIPTKFTTGGVANLTGGGSAQLNITYSRIGFGNVTEVGTISQAFDIFEKGDWEIVFHFKTVNPKFEND